MYCKTLKFDHPSFFTNWQTFSTLATTFHGSTWTAGLASGADFIMSLKFPIYSNRLGQKVTLQACIGMQAFKGLATRNPSACTELSNVKKQAKCIWACLVMPLNQLRLALSTNLH